MELRAYRIRGRVQGVGFRWWAQRVATDLGVGGHVRNVPDGSVELHASGLPETLIALETALQAGPSQARVDEVQRIDPDPTMPRDRFEIRH